jgi:hypothetical protein
MSEDVLNYTYNANAQNRDRGSQPVSEFLGVTAEAWQDLRIQWRNQ